MTQSNETSTDGGTGGQTDQAVEGIARLNLRDEKKSDASSHRSETDVSQRIAPAVTQELVQPVVHHETQDVITRDIHTHAVIHRVQPVVEREVLPERHFIPVDIDADGNYTQLEEVTYEQILEMRKKGLLVGGTATSAQPRMLPPTTTTTTTSTTR